MSVYRTIRPLVFQLPPETAHNIVAGIADRFSGPIKYLAGDGLRSYYDRRLETDICGITVTNPVGLAAGFDKGGRTVDVLHVVGFGYTEVGTVTGQQQDGNPRPRIFRYPRDHALINRMGFNSEGSERVALRLKGKSPRIPVGINIGKNKDVPLDRAVENYLFSLDNLFPFASYIVVNVSSPNTPGLRTLQEGDRLYPLLSNLKRRSAELADEHKKDHIPPMFVKISPDLADEDTDEVIQVVKQTRVDGIIATNTTVDTSVLDANETGGISGRPLTEKARQAVKHIYRKTNGEMPIIGVGGIMDADDAYNMIRAGASAIQLGTGLVYGGWGLADEIKRGLIARMERDGVPTIKDLVGVDIK